MVLNIDHIYIAGQSVINSLKDANIRVNFIVSRDIYQEYNSAVFA